jgi:dual specificity phosphatase 12
MFQVPGFSLNIPEQSVFFEPMSCIVPPTETLGGLYLGNIHAAQDVNLLLNSGVRGVLTVAAGTGLKYDPEYIPFHEEILADDVETFDL